MLRRAIQATLFLLIAIFFTIISEGILMTLWGCLVIAWGVLAVMGWKDYFDNNHPHTPKFS